MSVSPFNLGRRAPILLNSVKLAFTLALAFAFVFAATLVSPPPVQAQTQVQDDMRTMSQRLDRLQRELSDLQRAVFRGERPDPAERPEAPAITQDQAEAGTPLTQSAALRLQSRLDSLERELRSLTAQIEETRHQVRQMDERLETFEADVDLRLQDLEEAVAAGAAPGAAAGAGAAALAELEAGGAEAPQAPAIGGDAADRGPRTLGQVSEDAVAALRAEQAEAGETQAAAAPADDPLPEGSARERYDHAFSLLRQTEYDQAERALSAFLEEHGDHELAGNAQYWLGETYYVREQFDRAAVTFAEGFQAYPESNKAPDNLLKLGMSLSEIDRIEDACGIYAELLERYPQAPSNVLQRAEREAQRLECRG